MKAYWLPGISRYRLTEEEAQAEASVSPYSEAELPESAEEIVESINAMIAQHERNIAASDAAYEREEARAKELGYPSLRAALEELAALTGQSASTSSIASPQDAK